MLMRSRLYVPGNRPGMILNAGIYGADMIVLDLEDSVPPKEKDAARELVREALDHVDFGNSDVLIRINGPRSFPEDLSILSGSCSGVLLPKCEDPEVISNLAALLERRERDLGIESPHFLIIPLIESALGLLRAREIATASRVCAIALGVEDLSTDLGLHRPHDQALLYAKCHLVACARAAGIPPLDSVYSDVEDLDGLYKACISSRSLGFEGRGAIHPNQIEIIHKAFTPTEAEIKWARRVVEVAEAAESVGRGTVLVDGKMVDPPVVRRARRILECAYSPGIVLDLGPEVTE